MVTKISMWGNSLGLRIPKSMAAQLNLNEGSTVVLEHKDGRIEVTPSTPALTMTDFVKRMKQVGDYDGELSWKERGLESFWKDE